MKKVIFLICIFVIFVSCVSACENIINNNGVLINCNEYNKLKVFLTDSKIQYLTQEDFNNFNGWDIDTIQQENKYYEVSTYYLSDTNEELISVDSEITKEEYEAVENIDTRYNCPSGWICHSTTYKHIMLQIGCQENDNTDCSFYLSNEWKIIPSARSFDLIGFRWSGFTLGPLSGSQRALKNDNSVETTYSKSGTNSKYSSNGAGISMNLYDGSDVTLLEMDITARGTRTSSMNVYASYQHAKSDLTLSQSKSYSFASNGLGGVFYFSDSTIRNKYDNTAGLSVVGYTP